MNRHTTTAQPASPAPVPGSLPPCSASPSLWPLVPCLIGIAVTLGSFVGLNMARGWDGIVWALAGVVSGNVSSLLAGFGLIIVGRRFAPPKKGLIAVGYLCLAGPLLFFLWIQYLSGY